MSDVASTLKASGKGGGRTNDHEQSMVVSIAQNQHGEVRESNVAPSLSTGGGTLGEGYPAMRRGQTVRRLTPTERERLMGAPDGWTYDFGPSLVDAPMGLPVENACAVDFTPDGRREAATGDGVAVPCAEWIGRRIVAFEASVNPNPNQKEAA